MCSIPLSSSLRSSQWRLQNGRGDLRRGFGAAARTLFLFALALPVADALYRSSTGVPIVGSMAAPTYSYRAARENPAAFAMWWFYYLNEWIRDDGVRGAIEKAGPGEEAPLRPHSGEQRADVRHDDPDQRRRLPRAGDRA